MVEKQRNFCVHSDFRKDSTRKKNVAKNFSVRYKMAMCVLALNEKKLSMLQKR